MPRVNEKAVRRSQQELDDARERLEKQSRRDDLAPKTPAEIREREERADSTRYFVAQECATSIISDALQKMRLSGQVVRGSFGAALLLEMDDTDLGNIVGGWRAAPFIAIRNQLVAEGAA